MSYSNIFPAPGTLIDSSGQANPNGLPAPGFSGLNLTANESVSINRSRSARGLASSSDDFFWSFRVSYHNMTQDEYDAIEMFLLGHRAKKNPFYITLPNYAQPKPSSFTTFLNGQDLPCVAGSYAGDETITVISSNTSLLPGCYINLIDDADALHKSTYKVTRVETPLNYVGDPVASNRLRLSIYPHNKRDFIGNVTARFIKPQFRVVQTSDLEVEYDEHNIATFGFTCAELLP